ncbi:ABC-2 type transport system permease protein [Desulfotomaculum arcticum]|uniref:ABC-2 type transport system permease protein n=1 Tax=Desulfotruncus arcticus DSM 17038 TaxID=1121424 RepID=A0A1I2PHC0_9FIRM|nr:ABC transporter permease [Desulfotruncus arcticus]SFG15575.1 ABC-2 type transport system permease protein [Desulfotomaculum arcticum] [Desulfotruncus arcticus DSM 17038]
MRQVLTIAYYEIVHILRDRLLLGQIFFVPFLYTLLLGAVYIAGVLNNIPLGVVNLDNSQLSREVVTAFANSPHFQLNKQINSYSGLERAMGDGTVRAGLVIPEDYAQKVSLHQNTEVLIVYDSSNLIWGYNTRKYAREVINSFNIDHTSAYLAGLGLTKEEVQNTMDTVSLNMEVWYNPTYSYATFILLGIVLMVLHQIGLQSAGLTVTREKEQNSWLQFLSSSVPPWKIFLGKSLPYYISSFFNYALLLWLVDYLIHVKIGGSLFLIILLGALYILVIIAAGFYISVKAATSLQVTRYIMLLSVPFFIISGYTWPTRYIPAYINDLAHLLPFTWMAEGLRLVTLKGLGVHYLGNHILALSVMSAAALFPAITFGKPRKHASSQKQYYFRRT